jgi:autotransporter-associated beta strand protein
MKRRAIFTAGSLLALALHPVAAQDVWMNIQDQYWTNGANWADSSAPTGGEQVVFNSQSVPADTDLGGNFTLLSLAVTDAIVPVSISNHTLTLLAGGIDLSTAAQDLEIASMLNVATAQAWNVQAGRTLTVRGRVTGNGVATKQGAGALVMRGNDLRTVGTTLAAGETVVSGGVFNGTVTLDAGATLIARSGPGLVGEYYSVAPASNNFDTLFLTESHFATVNPILQHNFPAAGTDFDFGGAGANFPPGVPGSNFEGRWLGIFTAPSAGVYTFQTASDDGSMLWVDGTNVVFNNAFQPVATRTGTVELAAGSHALLIAYYQGGGGYGFHANVAAPGGPTNRISLADVQTGPALRTLVADPASTITLDGTLLTLAPAADSALPAPVGGSGGLRKIGTFALALTATNTFAGGLFLQGGTVTVAQAENLGAASNAVTILGSTLRVTGTTLTGLGGRALNEATFSGGFDIADAGHAFTVTNALSGRGSLTKAGAGALRLTAANAISGAVTVAAGTLHLTGSGALTDATNLVVNGTLVLEGAGSLSDAAALRLSALAGRAGGDFQRRIGDHRPVLHRRHPAALRHVGRHGQRGDAHQRHLVWRRRPVERLRGLRRRPGQRLLGCQRERKLERHQQLGGPGLCAGHEQHGVLHQRHHGGPHGDRGHSDAAARRPGLQLPVEQLDRDGQHDRAGGQRGHAGHRGA